MIIIMYNVELCVFRIIVLEAGRVAEFGSPQDLLERKGKFHGIVQDAGLV